MYDITRRSTFEHVAAWLHDLRQIAEESIVVILVGNKSDLATAAASSSTIVDRSVEAVNKRAVTVQEAEEWCRANGVMRYVETSAKSGEGVERAFLEVAGRIYENIQKGSYDLNDRRIGVRGPGTGPGGRAGGGTVSVGTNDSKGGKGWGRGCC